MSRKNTHLMCIASLIRFPIGLENKKTQMNILKQTSSKVPEFEIYL